LSSQIDKQLVFIEQNCRLNPQADAVLHLILAEIMEGVETMRIKQTNMEKREGFFKVLDALDNYNRYFNHPGWQPIARPVLANVHTGVASVSDSRIDLKLTSEERVEFLAEMRNMLSSIQGVMQGIGEADRERIAAAARLSGNRMARATPAAVRAKLPKSFQELGGPTHMMFEELAIRAETDDMDTLARDTATLMNQCMACHATFRAN
jgi:cytochrome c556